MHPDFSGIAVARIPGTAQRFAHDVGKLSGAGKGRLHPSEQMGVILKSHESAKAEGDHRRPLF